MNYPVTHRQTDNGHPCWPFRWDHERAIADGRRMAETENTGSVRSTTSGGAAGNRTRKTA